MSTETQESMATRPVAEHEWLKKLLGEWQVETEMTMGPDGPTQTGKGRETVKSLGGLWAFGEGEGEMPDGQKMTYYTVLGYDVSFKEYRGCWFASVSSHLWKYVGTLSGGGKVMTLECEGPDMENEGQTARYRDVIEFVDDSKRTLTSYVEGNDGQFNQMMKSTYTRI